MLLCHVLGLQYAQSFGTINVRMLVSLIRTENMGFLLFHVDGVPKMQLVLSTPESCSCCYAFLIKEHRSFESRPFHPPPQQKQRGLERQLGVFGSWLVKQQIFQEHPAPASKKENCAMGPSAFDA